MTEEEFWHTNPRKLKAYEEAWKFEQNQKNSMAYAMWGNYGLSALFTALTGVLTPMFCGKRSTTKFIEKPIRLFEMTEKELEEYKAEQTAMFVEWCNSIEKNWEQSNKPDSNLERR